LSEAVGTLAPIVAALMVCDGYVPPIETVQVFPEPPVIVPRLANELDRTVMPTTNAGLVVVVSVVPEHDAPANDSGAASLQTVVPPAIHVPVMPTQ
jgi:hypothetical protein